jgi:hypothetical protein
LVLENNASLYQSDDEIVNTNTIKIKRKTKPILKFDYTYWSSPVANQSLFNTSPETLSNKFFSFNPNTNSWLKFPVKLWLQQKDILFEDPKISLQQPEQLMKLVSGDTNNGEKTVLLGPASSFNLIGSISVCHRYRPFKGKCCFSKGNSISVVT